MVISNLRIAVLLLAGISPPTLAQTKNALDWSAFTYDTLRAQRGAILNNLDRCLPYVVRELSKTSPPDQLVWESPFQTDLARELSWVLKTVYIQQPGKSVQQSIEKNLEIARIQRKNIHGERYESVICFAEGHLGVAHSQATVARADSIAVARPVAVLSYADRMRKACIKSSEPPPAPGSLQRVAYDAALDIQLMGFESLDDPLAQTMVNLALAEGPEKNPVGYCLARERQAYLAERSDKTQTATGGSALLRNDDKTEANGSSGTGNLIMNSLILFGSQNDESKKVQTRAIHKPELDAGSCVKLAQLANGDPLSSYGSQVFSNQCGQTVEVFWCKIGDECERGAGGTWTVAAGSSYPVSSGQYRYGACKGANSGALIRDANGSHAGRYACPGP